jgi:hypothetical protein
MSAVRRTRKVPLITVILRSRKEGRSSGGNSVASRMTDAQYSFLSELMERMAGGEISSEQAAQLRSFVEVLRVRSYTQPEGGNSISFGAHLTTDVNAGRRVAPAPNAAVAKEPSVLGSADAVQRILRAVSTEITDCPRLFTISPQHSSIWRRMRIGSRGYRIVLWCEHPGYWHPWSMASYSFSEPKEWVARIKPHTRLISNALRPTVPGETYGRLEDNESANQLACAEGQALRALRILLFKWDPMHAFGDLRRVLSSAGDYLWVCPNHYIDYEPSSPNSAGAESAPN